MNRNRLFFVLSLFLILVATGCGKNVKVTGKVTYEDGEPLTVGRVCFEAGSFFADGPVKKDGTYSIGGATENSGIPSGDYQVYILGAAKLPEMLGEGRETTFAPPVPVIDGKFTDANTSGLKCTVKGRTVYDIKVTPP